MNLVHGTFYLTHGGDPEGGYVVLPSGEVYSVDCNMGKPFTAQLENGLTCTTYCCF
jgi:hypothetical protein